MIHKLMDHPHVVPFREAFEDEDQVYILLGLCDYGVRPPLSLCTQILTLFPRT